MIRRSTLFVCLGLLATGSHLAMAADLAPEIDMPEIAARTVANGWYVRGDLGYTGWSHAGKPDYTVYDADGSTSGGGFDTGRFSKPFSYGAGIGYQFNDTFRADVTGDFFKGNYAGTTSDGLGHKTDYDAIGILANGYVDLGTFAGFTPYLGAGAGVTHIDWGNTSEQGSCFAADDCAGSAFGSGRDSWRFTYALMAGVTYDLSTQMKLDVGYRYTDIAKGNMFSYGSVESGYGAAGAKGRDDGLSRHEIRAGLRFNF